MMYNVVRQLPELLNILFYSLQEEEYRDTPISNAIGTYYCYVMLCNILSHYVCNILARFHSGFLLGRGNVDHAKHTAPGTGVCP